jgi:hypothetical protein
MRIFKKEAYNMEMDKVTFSITMLVCGIGGTLLTLWIMSLIMTALTKIFPYKKEENND